MTTYAVTELGCFGDGRCCALAVPTVASVTVASDSAMATGVLIIDVPPLRNGETLFITHRSVIKTTFLLYKTVVSAMAGV